MADIFISYAREDRAVAAMLAGALARSPGVDDMMLPAAGGTGQNGMSGRGCGVVADASSQGEAE